MNAGADATDDGDLELTHPGRPLIPSAGLTKAGLARYYQRIAKVALPHWRDRPLTLRRFPEGIDDEGFFQKHAPKARPAWVQTVSLPAEEGKVCYLLVQDAPTLTWLANLSALELHLSPARRDAPRHPDRIVFDLDPSGDDFCAVQQAARRLRALLTELELDPMVQTTGSRGLHVVLSIVRDHDFDVVHRFAKGVASRLAKDYPEELTDAQRIAARGDRVFIDYLRNSYGQTSIAPYSLRAKPGAPVATPVSWEEALAKGFGPQRYRLDNLFRRLGQKRDPWADIANARQDLTPALKALGL